MAGHPLKLRPPFARWLFDRSLDFRKAASLLGCSHETVRLVCLPFDDAGRRIPGKELMQKIVALTEGEIDPNSFYGISADAALAAGPESEAA